MDNADARWRDGRTRIGIAAGVTLLALVAFGPLVAGGAAEAVRLDHMLEGPGPAGPLGTDELGRDVLARVVVASRLTLGLSLIATLLGASVGVLVGALPAVAPPWVGRLVATATNLALAFPTLLLTLFVAAILGAGAQSALLAIALAIAPIFARLTHTLAAGVGGADYVTAARALGARPLAILARHVLPNIAGPLLVTAVMAMGGAVVVLSGLSFLGLGVQAPAYDWGGLLNHALGRVWTDPAPALAPAAAIVFTGLALSLAGEAASILLGLSPVRRQRPPSARAASGSQIRPGDGLLEIDGLSVEVAGADGAPLGLVRDVSFALKAGERVAIVGESGSGKSMTVLAMAGLLDGRATASASAAWFGGAPLLGSGEPAARRRLGGEMPVIFQDPLAAFNPLLPVGVPLVEVGTRHGGLTRPAARGRAADRLAEVGIADPARRLAQPPHAFSGGMLQRAMIATALMAEPRLIIADEPTTALDVTVQRQVLERLGAACDETGAGLLLISHDLAVVAETCERVLVMYAGRLVEDLPAADLLTGPAHPYTRALLDCLLGPDADRDRPLPVLEGRPPRPEEHITGCAFAPRCAHADARCGTEAPELATAGGRRVACWRPLQARRAA
ncbi:MAG: peptide ABC transporter ATP-binding protein [Phenylobacterium zucineum]|nr:MAG: peptide ABC transporter ATP-binding protein [Phenylobacterium zucineum]